MTTNTTCEQILALFTELKTTLVDTITETFSQDQDSVESLLNQVFLDMQIQPQILNILSKIDKPSAEKVPRKKSAFTKFLKVNFKNYTGLFAEKAAQCRDDWKKLNADEKKQWDDYVSPIKECTFISVSGKNAGKKSKP